MSDRDPRPERDDLSAVPPDKTVIEQFEPDAASKQDKPKPFLEHLEELRGVLFSSLAFLTVGILVSIPTAPRIFTLLRAPLSTITDDPDRFLRSIEITGGFSILMRLVLWSGIIISAPFMALFAGRFIFPGLTRNERKVFLLGLGLAAALFVFGIMLGYVIALPMALQLMFRIHDWLSIRVEWTINSYLSFSMRLLLAFGLAFQIPVIILVLGYLGLISSNMLREKRRHAIIIILIMSAILTPADVFSQLAMGVPMILLYEFCVWIIWMLEKKKSK